MKKLAMLLILSAIMIGCGGKEEKKEEKETLKIGNADTQPTEQTNGTNIALSGNDMMQYDKKEFRVPAGKEVTLTFRHIGKLEKKVMGHNFVLLKPGTDITTFSIAASDAGEAADWIPDGGNDVIVHTKMLGGGETTSITFMAPEVGTYDFICSFPGHSAMMRGKFIVE
jgi:azurin